ARRPDPQPARRILRQGVDSRTGQAVGRGEFCQRLGRMLEFVAAEPGAGAKPEDTGWSLGDGADRSIRQLGPAVQRVESLAVEARDSLVRADPQRAVLGLE